MIVKVIFDLLNFSWCLIIKNLACYTIMFILFTQGISISIYGKMIYNILSKSQMQMTILNSPFQPKLNSDNYHNRSTILSPNQSLDDLNVKIPTSTTSTNTNINKKGLFQNKPKERVSILTISG